MDETSGVALLSIEPRWADAILSGGKAFEFRRTPPTLDVPFYVLLFATEPTGAIVGQARIDRVVEKDVPTLVAETVPETPHSSEEVTEYFSGKDVGAALHVEKTETFDSPIDRPTIESAIPGFTAPQNFMYLDADDHAELLNRLPTYVERTKQIGLGDLGARGDD